MHILAIDFSVERKKIISLAIGHQLPIPWNLIPVTKLLLVCFLNTIQQAPN